MLARYCKVIPLDRFQLRKGEFVILIGGCEEKHEKHDIDPTKAAVGGLLSGWWLCDTYSVHVFGHEMDTFSFKFGESKREQRHRGGASTAESRVA